jgi:epothilone polyketide synthase D
LDRAQQSRLEKSGFGAVDASRGMALFESVLGRSEAHLLPVPIDVRALRQSFGESVPPLWRSLVRARPRAASASRRVGWAGELALLSEGERLAAVVEIVRGEVARVLSLEGAQAVEADRPLKELGLDSLMAVELRNALGKRAGARLPATLAFDHPTPRRIAQYLIKKVLSPSDAPIVVAPITARPVEQDSLQKRISEIDQFSAAEMERELTQNIERVRAEFGL